MGRQPLGRRAQVTDFPRHGFDFGALTAKSLCQRIEHEPSGDAELEVDELRDQSALHEVRHLRGFIGTNRAVDLRQDVDHRVTGGDLIQALEDDGKLTEGHVSGRFRR